MIIGHGTRDPAGTQQFFELADQLRQHAAELDQPLPVEASLLEFQHPTIAEGWQRLVDQGVQHILAAPLLLFAAGHAREDIPDALRQAALDSPQVTWQLGRPLSRHRDLINLVTQRVRAGHKQSLSKSGPKAAPDNHYTLVMVGRGSYDPCARSDMMLLSEVTAHRLTGAHVVTAFYAMAEPRLPQILDQVASQHPDRPVIVYPHLLFQGRLFDAIKRQVSEAAERHPRVNFHVCDYLGPTREVAAALWGRATQHHLVLEDTSSPTAG